MLEVAWLAEVEVPDRVQGATRERMEKVCPLQYPAG